MILLLTLALVALGAASATPPLDAPPGRIRIAFEPAQPVKGRDGKVRVILVPSDSAGAPLVPVAPLVLSSSVGRLGPVTAGAEPGTFEATWEPSEGPQPEVLALVAIAPRCPLCATPLALGAARLPVAAAIELPGKSDPGVLTRVEIAGQIFGPVRADADGRFTLPVVVPPGTRWAQATSQSALGNERRTKLDLRLPEAPGLHCAAWPGRVPADDATEAGISCVGWSAAGGPLDLGSLHGGASRGAVADGAAADDGTWRARFRPPRGGAGSARLMFTWSHGGAQARTETDVGLAPGAPASIAWHVEGEPTVPGTRVKVSAKVLDANGDLLGEATADGRPIEGGLFQVRPELGDGVQRVALSWSEPPGREPAFLTLARSGGSWLATVRDVDRRPVAAVPLRFASGARAVTDARGEARIAAKGSVESVEGPAGLRAEGVQEGAPSPISIEREGRIALRPPGTVDVEAAREGGTIRWTVRGPDGAVLPGRTVKLTSEGVELGPVEHDGPGGRCAVRGGKGFVAIEDAESGATTLLEVR